MQLALNSVYHFRYVEHRFAVAFLTLHFDSLCFRSLTSRVYRARSQRAGRRNARASPIARILYAISLFRERSLGTFDAAVDVFRAPRSNPTAPTLGKKGARVKTISTQAARKTKRLSSIDAIAPRGKPSQNMRGNARRPLAIKRFVALKRRGRGGRGVRYFRRRSVRLPLIR